MFYTFIVFFDNFLIFYSKIINKSTTIKSLIHRCKNKTLSTQTIAKIKTEQIKIGIIPIIPNLPTSFASCNMCLTVCVLFYFFFEALCCAPV